MPKPRLLPPEKGTVFGRLTVVGPPFKTPERTGYYVKVRCACGERREVKISKLRSGHTISCGCARTDRFTEFATSHGQRFEPVYHVWLAMRQRCLNPKNKSYVNYGGRGITVCKRWDSFVNFISDMGPRPPGLTLERKNNNRGYCPSNCVWATRTAQNNNTRRNLKHRKEL